MSIRRIVLMLLVSFVLLGCSSVGTKLELTEANGYYPKDSQTYLDSTPVMKQLLDLQNAITETLRVKDNKYVYDKKVIKKLVDAFDFSKVNKEVEFKYTNNSFFDVVIRNLDETVLGSK